MMLRAYGHERIGRLLGINERESQLGLHQARIWIRESGLSNVLNSYGFISSPLSPSETRGFFIKIWQIYGTINFGMFNYVIRSSTGKLFPTFCVYSSNKHTQYPTWASPLLPAPHSFCGHVFAAPWGLLRSRLRLCQFFYSFQHGIVIAKRIFISSLAFFHFGKVTLRDSNMDARAPRGLSS